MSGEYTVAWPHERYSCLPAMVSRKRPASGPILRAPCESSRGAGYARQAWIFTALLSGKLSGVSLVAIPFEALKLGPLRLIICFLFDFLSLSTSCTGLPYEKPYIRC